MSGARAGWVYLVGAGPGDPTLFTLRGTALLSSADVVLYDGLAPMRLLDGARPGAQLIYVGKKRLPPGQRRRTQAQINALMVEHARAGRSVVRLKGGDPFVFARGAEEALHLAEAGVPFEVVPGVSSGIAALTYAGIPLTHRAFTSEAVFVTGHAHEGDAEVDWSLLADRRTLVLFMAVATLEEITGKLLAHGRDGAQPAAAIRWGTRPDQRVIEGTLEDIAQKCAQASLRPPAIVVVGEVVRLRAQLDWFSRRALHGRRIVVTRPKNQSVELVGALESLGAEVVQAPAIEILPADDPAPLDRALARLGDYDWVVFTSANAVEHTCARLEAAGKDARVFGSNRIAAVGEATAQALLRFGLRADLVPERKDAQGLLEALPLEAGTRVLMPRAERGRDTFPDGARAAGALVDVVTAYRTVERPDAATKIEGDVDAVVLASSSAVHALAAALEGALAQARCVCVGAATLETLRATGRDGTTPTAPGTPELVDHLVELLAS